MALEDFLDYFLNPVKSGYDIPKTLTYAAVLILAVFLTYKLLRRLKIKIDKRLAIGVAPYVVLGGILRVLQDGGVINSYWFITPGIYFFIYSIVIAILLISTLIERKKGIPYFKTMFLIGLFLVSFALPFVKIINLDSSLLVLTFFLPWVVIFTLFRWNKENKLVSLIHLFDANTTFVAMQFLGYGEQHVLPAAITSAASPFSFIFLKAAVVISVLILIDKYTKNKEFGRFLKLIIGILGAATASRDFIRILALV